jgi:hypothetical protein
VLKWGKAEAERTKETQAEVLKDIIPHIRFPLFKMEEVVAKVQPLKLLTAEQMLSVYTWMGASKTNKPKCVFKAEKRGSGGSDEWTWSTSKKPTTVTVSEEGVKLTSSGSNWQNVGGDIVFTEGVHEWEVTLDSYDTTNSYNVVLGVTPSSNESYWTSSSLMVCCRLASLFLWPRSFLNHSPCRRPLFFSHQAYGANPGFGFVTGMGQSTKGDSTYSLQSFGVRFLLQLSPWPVWLNFAC